MYALAIDPTFSPLPDARVSPLTKSSSPSSSLSSLISPIVHLGLGVSYTDGAAEVVGMATTSVSVPTSKCRDGRGGGGGCYFSFFFASVSV